MKKILNFGSILFLLSLFAISSSNASDSYFIDFSKVLNQSTAGKKAQDYLKKKFKSETDKFVKSEKKLKEEEKQIISQRKIITKEEYKKKVESLRKKVFALQKSKQESINKIGDQRAKAKNELLKALNPIIKKYMEDNKIRLVLDKKAVLLGDTKLEITDQIIDSLNKEVKTIKLD